jgi:hypothetical protein
MPTLMDQQEVCVGYLKDGTIIGWPCKDIHRYHVCLFDLITTQRLCAAYPKCRKRLRARPRAVPGRVYIYLDLVAVRWEG